MYILCIINELQRIFQEEYARAEFAPQKLDINGGVCATALDISINRTLFCLTFSARLAGWLSS